MKNRDLIDNVEAYYKECIATAKTRREHRIDQKTQSIRSLLGKIQSRHQAVNKERGFLGGLLNKVVDLNYGNIMDTFDDVESDLINLLDNIEE